MFEVAENVTYHGAVREYRWQNPHSHIVITVGSGAKDCRCAPYNGKAVETRTRANRALSSSHDFYQQ